MNGERNNKEAKVDQDEVNREPEVGTETCCTGDSSCFLTRDLTRGLLSLKLLP